MEGKSSKGVSSIGDSDTTSTLNTSARRAGSVSPPVSKDNNTNAKILIDSGSTTNTSFHDAHDEVVSMSKIVQQNDKVEVKKDATISSEKSANSNGGDIANSLFNEVDMSGYINLRKIYGEQFMKKHNIKLGFMSGFLKAATMALKD